MKKNTIIYFILLIYSLLGCENSNNLRINYINDRLVEKIDCKELLNSLNDKSLIYLDDIIDSIKVIKIESCDMSLFGLIKDCKISKNYIYINDFNRQVMIFDIDGNFIKSIKRGNGPGEISSPNCIAYNNYTHEFLIFQYNTILKYSEGGEYITSIKVPFLIHDCISFEKGYILFQKSTENKLNKSLLIITDFEFNQTNIFTFDREYPFIYPPYLFSKNNENIIFSRCFDKNIYCFNDTSFYIKYKYELGNQELFIEEENEMYNHEKYDNIVDKFQINGIYAENFNYQIFEFKQEQKVYKVFRNKEKNKMIIGNYFPTITGLGFFICRGQLFGTHNNYFVNVLTHEQLPPQVYIDNLSVNKHISQEDVDKIKNFKDDDNPLIILYTLNGLE